MVDKRTPQELPADEPMRTSNRHTLSEEAQVPFGEN